MPIDNFAVLTVLGGDWAVIVCTLDGLALFWSNFIVGIL